MSFAVGYQGWDTGITIAKSLGVYDRSVVPIGCSKETHASRSYEFVPAVSSSGNRDIRSGKDMYRGVFVITASLTAVLGFYAFRKRIKKINV